MNARSNAPRRSGSLSLLMAGLAFVPVSHVHAQEVGDAPAVVETQAIPSGADALRDVALHVNGSRLFVIVSDAQAGVLVQAQDGGTLSFRSDGVIVGVDVVEDFVLPDGSAGPVVVAANRTLSGFMLYALDDTQGTLTPLLATVLGQGSEPDALVAFRSGKDSQVYVMAASGSVGRLRQWVVTEGAAPTATLVRDFELGSEVAGLAVHEETDTLYVAVRQTGLRRYPASADAGTQGSTFGAGLSTPLSAVDVFGLPDGGAYVLASEQVESRFAVLAGGDGQLLGRFRVTEGVDAGVDAVQESGALALSATPVPSLSASGVLAVSDRTNPFDFGPNVKLVPWESVVRAASLGLPPSPSDGGVPAPGKGGFIPGAPPGDNTSRHTDDDGCTTASAGLSLLSGLVVLLSLRAARRRSRVEDSRRSS